MKFTASINNGTLKFDQPETLTAFLEKKEGRVVVTIQSNSKRSQDQNAWLWSGIYPALADNGDDPYLWHCRCKIAFIPQIFGLPSTNWGTLSDEQVLKYGPAFTTTELSTNQMTDYIEAIRRMAALKFGINIEDPRG